MSDTNTIKTWAFPFKTAGDASKEVTDPQLYYDALAKAKNGFYPMGANGLWHGGVHFDAGTAALLDQSAVRCIADGEVIAYRIDERYPSAIYGEGPAAVQAPYSTGFVLVKHRLELPPLPTAPAAPSTPTSTSAAAPTMPAAAEALTFYSLYMHLLDWQGYQASRAPLPPPFLAETSHLISDRCTDPVLGLRVRKEPKGGSTEVLALLPKGCKVTLGIADINDPRWKQLTSIEEGAAVPPLPSGVIGWVYANELTSGTVADQAKDSEPALTLSHQGLNVRKEGKLTGAIIGVLPRGAKIKLGEKSTIDSNYYELLEVLDYKGVPALPNGPDGKPLGYVYLSKLDASPGEPKAKDAVYPLPTPYPIKAGEPIGHLGQYQNHDDSAPQTLLHLEVFSCEDVPAFNAMSQTRASSLPAEQKTLLKVHKGASKLIPHRADISASNPPKITDAGVTVGMDLIIPVSVLKSLPADRKMRVSEAVPGSTTPSITQWWRLDNLLADAAGNPISGWLAEQDLITTRHSPWEWEGFDFISETVCAADQFACHLDAQRLLSETELPDYQAQISTADNGPVKTRLYDIIDGADGTVRDDKLTASEIRAALGKPWHAQSISRLITRYESEWFWKAAKWDELDKLMEHTPADPNTDWVEEKNRIQTLSWWGEMAGKQGISADGMAWHFQLAGLIGNFLSPKRCFCYEQGIVNTPCQQGVADVTKEHFELLAVQLGVEREVLRAIAVAETGDKTPFKEYIPGERHAIILYERHYMRRLLLNTGFSQPHIDNLSIDEPKIVHRFESGYSYGSMDEQYTRLKRARELNEDAANMSCSWGKFQVMGEYYHHLYKSTKELVEAQNHCALQHLQYFKKFLTDEKRMLDSMKNKRWTDIAEKYNGRSQVGYDTRIQAAYEELKRNW